MEMVLEIGIILNGSVDEEIEAAYKQMRDQLIKSD
jgi:hypothetical protein